MEGKNKIVVYRDWITTFDSLTDEEAGKLIKHFFRYINDLNPKTPDRITGLLFEPIKQTLKRDLIKYKAICLKNKENVEIRWNKEDTTEYDRIRTDTKHTDNDSDKDSDKDKDRFNFKASLIALGVSENIVSDWLKVRKSKKATNTETAFNRIKKQIELTGVSANDCITMAVENSWQGFEADWYFKKKPEDKQMMP